MAENIFAIPLVGAVLVRFRKDAAINPAAAGRGTVVFQVLEPCNQLLAIGRSR